MSYTEIHTGKLKKLEVEDVKSWMIEKLFDNGVSVHIDKSIDELNDMFFDNDLCDKYYIHKRNGKYTVFEILDHYEDEFNEDLSHITKLPDGVYDFVFVFYNGGTYFNEVMGYALDDIKEQ